MSTSLIRLCAAVALAVLSGLHLERPLGHGAALDGQALTLPHASGAVLTLGRSTVVDGARALDVGSRRLGAEEVITDGEVTEVLASRASGIEQSWRFSRRPEGSVTVRVPTNAARATADARGLTLFVGDAAFSYSHATWRDAAGAERPVLARFEAGALVMTLPEELLAAAQYPAVLDPLLSAETQLTTPTPSTFASLSSPAVAFDGTNFFVVWRDQRIGGTFSNDPLLVGTRVTPAGVVLDPAGIVINRENSFATFAPSVSFDGTSFVVAWVDSRYSRSTGLNREDAFVARVSTQGQLLDAQNLRASLATQDISNVSVASAQGLTLVAWNIAGQVVGRRLSSAGQWLDAAPFTIDTSTSGALDVLVRSSGSEFMVSWTRYVNATLDRELFAKRVATTGAVLSASPIAVTTGANDQRAMSAAFAGGQYLYAWEEVRGGGRNIIGARVSATGTVLDPAGFFITNAAANNRYQPQVMSDGTQFLVAWTRVGGGTTMQLSTVSTAGVVGAAVDLTAVGIYSAAAYGGGAALYASTNSGPTLSVVPGNASALPTVDAGIPAAVYADYQDAPKVAFDGTQYVATWVSISGPGATSSLQVARVSRSGAALDLVGPRFGAPLGYGAIASSGAESLVVFSDGASSGVIKGAVIGLDGVAAAPQTLVNIGTSSNDSPSVAWDGQRYALAWRERHSFLYGGSADVHVQRYQLGSGPVDAGGFVIAANADFQLAVAANGPDVLVAYGNYVAGSDYNLVATVAGADGGAQWPQPVTLGAFPGVDDTPAAAYARGTYAVTWTKYFPDGGERAYVRRVRSDGTLLDAQPRQVAAVTAAQGITAVAAISEGFLLAWEQSVDGGLDVHGARLFDDGGLEAPFVLAAGVRDDHAPALAAQPDGGALLVWSRLLEGTGLGNRRMLARTVTWLARGAACTASTDCGSGFCVDGVCCESACGGGAMDDCQACSAARGATTDGTCTPLSARACDDHDLCTQTDTCAAGACQGANPVVCPTPAVCRGAGVCSPASGTCSSPALANGTACSDANACTTADHCQAGACVGDAVVCNPAECQVASACNGTTGGCDTTNAADGTACTGGSCQAGACVTGGTGGGMAGTGGGTSATGGGTGGGDAPASGCGCHTTPASALLFAVLALARRRRQV